MFYLSNLSNERDICFRHYDENIKVIHFAGRGNTQVDTLIDVCSGLNHYLCWLKQNDYDEFKFVNNCILKDLNALSVCLSTVNMDFIDLSISSFNHLLLSELSKLCKLDNYTKSIVSYIRANTVEVDESKTMKNTVGFTNSSLILLNAFSVASRIAYIFMMHVRQVDTKLKFNDIVILFRPQLCLLLSKEIILQETANSSLLELVPEELNDIAEDVASTLNTTIKNLISDRWNRNNHINFTFKFEEIGLCVDNISSDNMDKVYGNIKVLKPVIADLDTEDSDITFTPDIENRLDEFKFVGTNTTKFLQKIVKNLMTYTTQQKLMSINATGISLPTIVSENYIDDKCEFIKASREKQKFDIANNKSVYIMDMVNNYLLNKLNRNELDEYVSNKTFNLSLTFDFNKFLLQQLYAYSGCSESLYNILGESNKFVLTAIRFHFKNNNYGYIGDIIENGVKNEREIYNTVDVERKLKELNFVVSEQQIEGIMLMLNREYLTRDSLNNVVHIVLTVNDVVSIYRLLKSLFYNSNYDNRLNKVVSKNNLKSLGLVY